METLSDEAATDGATRAEAVAQAPQEQGLPDLDHARHFLAVSAAVPVTTTKTEISSRIYYVVRPLL